MRIHRIAISLAGLIPALLLSACGYHVGGKADTIPKSIQTIAVLPFGNNTTRYQLADKLSQAIARELVARTRYQVVNDPKNSDAVLSGAVNQVYLAPAVIDPGSGKTTGTEVVVLLNVSLKERTTGKVLYSRPNLAVRNMYESSVDARQYFDESSNAFNRLSRDLARSVVTGILEDF
jgi:hypothetical protein